jgi:plastocyanin
MNALIVLWMLSQAPAPTCQISGTVKLKRNGAEAPTRDKVVVYVRHVDARYWNREKAKNEIVQQFKNFKPALKVVLKGEEIDFINKDRGTPHNIFVKSDLMQKGINVATSKEDQTGSYTFNKEGNVHLRCAIHKDMNAEILVLDNPFFAIVGDDGSFQLPDLPAGGDYEIVAWETYGASQGPQKIGRCSGKQVKHFRLDGNLAPPQVAFTGGVTVPDTYQRD